MIDHITILARCYLKLVTTTTRKHVYWRKRELLRSSQPFRHYHYDFNRSSFCEMWKVGALKKSVNCSISQKETSGSYFIEPESVYGITWHHAFSNQTRQKTGKNYVTQRGRLIRLGNQIVESIFHPSIAFVSLG